jgi:hypothetical protein
MECAVTASCDVSHSSEGLFDQIEGLHDIDDINDAVKRAHRRAKDSTSALAELRRDLADLSFKLNLIRSTTIENLIKLR